MRKRMVGTRLSSDVLGNVKIWAKERGLTTSTAVEELVQRGLINDDELRKILRVAGWESRPYAQILGALLCFSEYCRKIPDLLEGWTEYAHKILERPR